MPRERLKVLYAGNVNLQKGVPYMLDAFKAIGPRGLEVRIAGEIRVRREALRPYGDIVSFVGHVPRSKMFELYKWADVFVFPTLCDSFGLVQVEALTAGVPVVATTNCGDVVRDGVDGFVVPIRDSNAIANALDSYIRDRAMLREHKNAAIEVGKRFGIDVYRNNVHSFVVSLSDIRLS